MLHLPSKALFHLLAQSPLVRKLASRYGMVKETGFARRFIAGETIEEALVAARAIQEQGFLLTLDYLGESVITPNAATAATNEYLRLLSVIADAGVERNISLKLTQLGLDIGRPVPADGDVGQIDPQFEQPVGHPWTIAVGHPAGQHLRAGHQNSCACAHR